MTEVIKQRGNFNMIKNNNNETKGKTTTTNKLKNLIEVMKQKENQKTFEKSDRSNETKGEKKKEKKTDRNNQTKKIPLTRERKEAKMLSN